MLNSLTIHAIRRTMSLPKPLKTLLMSLAVSDLGVGLLVQPLGIAMFVMEMEPNAASSPTYITMKDFAFLVPAILFYYATFFGVTAHLVIYATIELVCLLTTALLYGKIYLAVRRHAREIQVLQVQGEALNGQAINAARQRKSSVGTFYVYIVFLAWYLPFNCWCITMLID